ncbi:hypothetical protein LCI18_012371 [Fusarium solani-melongenae]|uniref:Uncharacterized protein n=1 Tax=Fusarium solani subsp. cucurbitae TaxID=2747967 RepID=A0ACD3ZKQ6_FUSSC|nr:hypothetical protein LCI18_012371 [Fusarium solani-melongenae]
MRFARLPPWGGRSSGSSRRGDGDSNSDNEGTTTKEHQRNVPDAGGTFVFAGILIVQWFNPPEGVLDAFKMWTMTRPGVGWPSVFLVAIDAAPGFLNWWSTDSKNRTISTIPQARFISPISAEEAFVIPEYLTTFKSSITRLNDMDGNFALPPAMEDSLQRAIKEAKLFKEIHDGWMTDMKLRFNGHYDQLSQLHIDIERSIIDIADRSETKTSYFGGLFTRDQPYARARNHHKSLRSITDDMSKATKSEMKRLGNYNKKLHDLRADVKVMCNSSKRSKVKLDMAKEALKHHLGSIDAVRRGLLALQHDQAKTLETALLNYCKSLLEAMRRLAEFGNG